MLLLGVRLGARETLQRPPMLLLLVVEPLKGPKVRKMPRVVGWAATERAREREGARTVDGARVEASWMDTGRAMDGARLWERERPLVAVVYCEGALEKALMNEGARLRLGERPRLGARL